MTIDEDLKDLPSQTLWDLCHSLSENRAKRLGREPETFKEISNAGSS
jgi:hypothetical protein